MLLGSKVIRLCRLPMYWCRFMTKKDWKLISDKTYWANYMDDLNINAETYQYSSSKDLLREVRDNPENEFYAKSIGQLLYYMGKDGVRDEAVFKKIEKCLYKFKHEFPPRLAFGALYGFISLSIENEYMHDFFDAEFRNHWQDHDWKEALELMEACGKNKNLSRKYLFDLMKQFCEPLLLQEYKVRIRFSPGSQIRLLNACINAKYFEPELFDPLVQHLVKQVKINRLPTWLQLWKTLSNLETGGDFPRSIQDQIDIMVDRLKAIPKYAWVYNFDEQRYRTMQELKAVREDAPKQFAGYHLHDPSYLEGYLKAKAKGNQEEVEREKKLIQEKVLDDLLYDQFMLGKVEEQRSKEDQKKGMKDEDQEEDDEESPISEQEKKDLLTDFQKQHFETLNLEEMNPDDIPMEWLEETAAGQSDEFSELEEKIKEATEAKQSGASPKSKVLKKRKGRTGKMDEAFNAIE